MHLLLLHRRVWLAEEVGRRVRCPEASSVSASGSETEI